jgi:hypothetical protein
VEAISQNSRFSTSSSGIQNVTFYWGPVADGVGIEVSSNGALKEDTEFSINVTYRGIDIDGSETIEEWAYLQLDNAVLTGPTGYYEYFEGPFVYQGETIVGPYYRIRASNLSGLKILPALHWHGDVTGRIYMSAMESLAPYPIKLSKGEFKFTVSAVADLPLLTVPSTTILMNENVASVISGLSALLVDNVTANGREYLSVVISNVPEDSIFSKGAPSSNGKCELPLRHKYR